MTKVSMLVTARSLEPQLARFVDRVRAIDDVRAIAVFPDVHLAGDDASASCVGTAIATRASLVPAWLGSDLGCGIAALPIAASSDRVRDRSTAARALRAIASAVPVLRHRDALKLPAIDGMERGSAELVRHLERAGRHELGSLGRGNHFVELRHERGCGALWLLVHTGSRSLGPTLQDWYRSRAVDRRGGWERLDATSERGLAYLDDVAIAVAWARANRAQIVVRALDAVSDVVEVAPEHGALTETHHDSVLCERHAIAGDQAERLFVHRKGAMKLDPGELGLVPGSMGADVAIVRARDDAPPSALGSSAHGAGRSLTRTAARRRYGASDLRRAMDGVTFDGRIASALRDEIPHAYKDLDEVLRAERALVRVVSVLEPVLVHKGSG